MATDRIEGLLGKLLRVAVDSDVGEGRLAGIDLTDGTGWKGSRTLDGTGLGGGRETGTGVGGGLWKTATELGALGRLGPLETLVILETLEALETVRRLGTVLGRRGASRRTVEPGVEA